MGPHPHATSSGSSSASAARSSPRASSSTSMRPQPETAAHHLKEASSSAAEYGRVAATLGLSLSQTVEGFLRFRAPFHHELAVAARRRGFDTAETTDLLETAERAMDRLLVATMTGHRLEPNPRRRGLPADGGRSTRIATRERSVAGPIVALVDPRPPRPGCRARTVRDATPRRDGRYERCCSRPATGSRPISWHPTARGRIAVASALPAGGEALIGEPRGPPRDHRRGRARLGRRRRGSGPPPAPRRRWTRRARPARSTRRSSGCSRSRFRPGVALDRGVRARSARSRMWRSRRSSGRQARSAVATSSSSAPARWVAWPPGPRQPPGRRSRSRTARPTGAASLATATGARIEEFDPGRRAGDVRGRHRRARRTVADRRRDDRRAGRERDRRRRPLGAGGGPRRGSSASLGPRFVSADALALADVGPGRAEDGSRSPRRGARSIARRRSFSTGCSAATGARRPRRS